ncbi:MAG: transcriptional regulator NrdR [Planctomycetota bacterium]|nr:transcriptional regulator NrdR [Planctomycetota bacterium]MDP7134843.1 transcriptional regulator NrdR [Planctomycetota bacterium]MDP7252431.1 transcriptional regulator NrdR [Planctomycetota bacterium]
MRCPYCKVNRDKVVDSRSSADEMEIRRRRECLSCGRRYTTYERVAETSLRVIKKDGRRAPFERGKIMEGLYKACEKRSVSVEVLEEIVNDIEKECSERFEKEVPTKFIGSLIMQHLQKTDPVAYVRFASVYREFKDITDFADELRKIVQDRGGTG